MFEKNLTDLVRGIRNSKNGEAKYIASCLDEIKQELRQQDAAVKANAVSKLTYLQMIGYDISWAAFNIIEVMSSAKFTFKRIGYFAASQCFHEDLDILMLTTNMIRKDLCSMNMYDSGVALTGFACFVSADLARDLANDVMSLLVSTKPYVRKRAVLLMYKIFLKFPESLRPAFPRLKDKLEDPDSGVQSAAVNVICELARKNPKNYLSLAPLFFKLMTSSTNNWMLIKIIKLFGALCPLEPRLGKKILEPLTNLIHSTSAMSLLYECINTVISALPNHTASVQLSLSKLRLLIEDPDQNLKYLGLLAMSKILKCQPKLVQNHKDIIMHCLDDRDESIKLRALDLIVGMVSKKNIMEIVKKLMVHIDKADSQSYSDELVSKIILICSLKDFHYITNFEWYLDVLIQLTRVDGTRHGRLIASQMMDVTIRVKAIRSYAVQVLSLLLDNSHLLSASGQKNGVCEVLYAAAWVSGEFTEYLPDPQNTLQALFHPRATSLPGHIQAVYVQNIAKLYASILKITEEESDEETAAQIGQYLTDKLPMFVQSADLEVQERASCILHLIKYVVKLQAKGVSCASEVSLLFAGELNPVAAKAQKKVPVPEGLDLDKWINEPLSESSEEEQDIEAIFVDKTPEHRSLSQREPEIAEEELERRRKQRKEDQLSNPHYLRQDKAKRSSMGETPMAVDDIPVANLDLPVALKVSGMKKTYSAKTRKKKRKRGRKGSRADESAEEDQKYEVLPTLEMPEGAAESDEEKPEPVITDVSDPHSLLNVDLEKPLEASEALPVRTHRTSPLKMEHSKEEEEEGHRPKKHRHRKDKKEKSKHKHKKDKTDKKSKKRRSPHSGKEPDAAVEKDLMMNGETEASEPAAPGPEPAPAETEPEAKPAETQLDDMEFWLSTPPTSPVATEAPISSPAATTTTVVSSAVAEEPGEHKKPEKEHREQKKRHGKKEKHDKDKKKDRRKKDAPTKPQPGAQPPEAPADSAEPPSIMSLEESAEPSPAPVINTYKVLSENASLRLMYEARVTTQQRNQVVISIIFSNLTELHVKSMEFNVLDSLNLKLVRPIGATKHDSVPVPFHLLPGSSNEGQFAFDVDSIAMSQKLRGTLTYMITDAQGSTSEKMDFTVHFPCSSFLVATPLASAGFASLLGSGTLANKSSVKAATPDGTAFSEMIRKICVLLHFAVVEQVDNSASLYTRSIQDHHVCVLVKQLDGNSVSVDGKSTDSGLVSGVLSEMKTLLQS